METISVDKIKPHPLNPRCDFSHVNELAENIKEHGGHPFNPIMVRPLSGGYYQIIAGHTRFKALTEVLGRTELEIGRDVIIREIGDDITTIRVMVDDNIKQWKYKPAEFVEALRLLINSCGMSIRKVAQQYGVSVGWLTDILGIAKLPDRVKEKVEWGKGKTVEAVSNGEPHKSAITVSHAKHLVQLDNREQQNKVASAIEKYGLTSAETKQVVNAIKQNPWTPVDDIVHIIRNNPVSQVVGSFVVEILDTRVAKALSIAASTTKKTPEEYASEKLIEGLVNDGFLDIRVLQQDEYRRWMENEIVASKTS